MVSTTGSTPVLALAGCSTWTPEVNGNALIPPIGKYQPGLLPSIKEH